jgi:hypothetical protein
MDWRSFLPIITVSDGKRPGVSGPIRSVKMYRCVQCTMQKRSVCCRDVPCLAHTEQGPGPSSLSTHPPSHLPGWVLGIQSTSSLQLGWTWTVEWTLASSPPRTCGPGNVCWYCLYFHLEYCLLECLSNDYLHSTDCCYIFRLINHNKE